MDDDLAFEPAAASHRSAKQGRRAAGNRSLNPPDAPAFESTQQNDSPNLRSRPPPDDDMDSGPPKPNRVSGWGEDNPRRSRKLGEGFEPFEEDLFKDIDNAFGYRERLRPRTPDDDSSDTEIPVIPDLEEQQEDDLTTKVAYAPNVAVNRVATYRELDNDLLRQAAFLTLDNEIDLKLLTKCLSPEADVIDDDKPWDWDRLFTEVTSELALHGNTTEESDSHEQVLP